MSDRNVTMATQAAFAAINDMFGDSLPPPTAAQQPGSERITTEQRDAPPTGAPAQRQAQRQLSADVTIATRGAFDAVNAMFHGALPQDALWPRDGDATCQIRRDARRRGARVSMGAGLLGAGQLPSSYSSMHAQPASDAAAPEPTVTISTRAAFEALNDMFGARLPHEATGRVAPPQSGMQGRSREGAAGFHCSVREPAPQEQDGGFSVYEDTQFVGAEAMAAHPDSTMPVYEDTQFLGRGEGPAASPGMHARPQQAGGEGLQLYEDTEFMTENAVPVQSSSAAAAAAAAGELQLYEDRQFLSAAQGSRPPHAPRARVLQQRAGSPAAAAERDVTAFMTENVAPAASALEQHALRGAWDIPPADDQVRKPCSLTSMQCAPCSALLGLPATPLNMKTFRLDTGECQRQRRHAAAAGAAAVAGGRMRAAGPVRGARGRPGH
jgi:hypothetical protein